MPIDPTQISWKRYDQGADLRYIAITSWANGTLHTNSSVAGAARCLPD